MKMYSVPVKVPYYKPVFILFNAIRGELWTIRFYCNNNVIFFKYNIIKHEYIIGSWNFEKKIIPL